MPRDMIPLRPIEGAAEYPLTVDNWLTIKYRRSLMHSYPLPPTKNESEWIGTFFRNAPDGSRYTLISFPVIRRAA